MKFHVMALALSLPLATSASPPPPDGGRRVDHEREKVIVEVKSVEEKIAELESERATLVEERDAARMRANVYVLPKDKLEAEQKEKEIQEIDEELRALRKEAASRR